jgi:hypothetical protein
VVLRPNAGHGLLFLWVSKSHTTTHHSRYDPSGRVIGPLQRPLLDKSYNRHTTMPPLGIETQSQQASDRTCMSLDPAATGIGLCIYIYIHVYIYTYLITYLVTYLTFSQLMLHICRVSKTLGEVRRQSNNAWQLFCDRFLKRPLLTVSSSFMNVANRVVVKDGDYFEGQ